LSLDIACQKLPKKMRLLSLLPNSYKNIYACFHGFYNERDIQMKNMASTDDGFVQTALSKDMWIFDMDGVLYRGRDAIPGAPEAIALLRRLSKKVVFLTNNSTRTREMYIELLDGMGIGTTIDEIFTSASITIDWLESRAVDEGKQIGAVNVYVIGEDGLTIDLRKRGFAVKTDDDLDTDRAACRSIDFVIVGLDRNLTYKKLDIALTCIMGGAKFLATNEDAALPVEGGAIAPGAGAIVQALVTCSKQRPDFGSPFGKPNPAVFHEIARSTGTSLEAMISVGDRLETDILASKRAGVTCVLVLSGITKAGDQIPEEMAPDFILDSIDVLNELLEKEETE
jgi:phosphoglycolate/pyridoxal phosphate phosphatase family enzyme